MTSSIHLARNALLWAPHGPERPGNAGTGRSSMPAERLQRLEHQASGYSDITRVKLTLVKLHV